ncbi:hypothetical protein Tco_1570062 [Tanacetum coccineum]
MSITKEQQQALDDALVPREQRLRIGNCNYRLSTTFKPKEPTFQVALDVLSLTPFYQAFLISASVPAIYMHEFWATATFQKHCIKFKLNTKRYSFDLETFRDMLQICPKIPGQKFVDPPFEEEILTFMRELGYSGNIKSLSDVKVEMLPQPWRTFRTIINKCLSGKVTGLDLLRLSRAQILWGMFHQKNVDYVYLLWEDLVFQIENKVSKRNNDMYYPRFTKVIINHFMSQDQSIPRRNKVDWHMAKDDPVLTTMRFIPQHEVIQKYGVILLDYLTNQAMKESEEYKTYYDLATGKVAPKPKYVRRSIRTKTDQAPQDAPGKRLKAIAKVAKLGKKKQPARGLETLSEIALSEAEQMKIAIERSKTQLHSSHASGSGADEGTGVSPGVPDVPIDGFEDEHISWKSSDEDGDEEVSISKDDDDDADDQDDDDQEYDGQDDVNEQTELDNDGDDFVHPKFFTHDQEERQVEEDKQEEGSDLRVQTPSHYESTDDEVSQGANVKGEEMDEEETNEEEKVNELYWDVNVNLEGRDTEMTDALQTNVQGFISNMFNPNPDTGIDSILNLNTELTTLVDVPVISNAEMPPSSATTPPPPPIPPIQPLQQTPVPTPTIVPSTSLQDLLNFVSLFKFEDRLDRLRDEAQAENADFINKLYDNIKKIIKEQVKVQVKDQVSKILPKIEKLINDQLEAEVLTRSSNEAKTSHTIAANLSELELKKILIDKIENIVTIKRRRDDQDEDEEPSVGPNQGSKRRRAGKNLNQQKPTKPQTPDRDWNKTLPAAHGAIQPWINNLAQKEDTRDSFNELMDTPLDFSGFVMNRLKVDTPTLELLAGPTFELMKGSCKSLVELEYFLEEVCKATTDKLDWNNPEGQQYPHDMRKPLPLIPNSQVTKTKAADYGHVKWIEDLVPNTIESAHDVYSRHRIIVITKLQIVKWHNYKHLDWITVRRNDDKLYTFKEGDYKRLRLQDIEDMLLLLVQGKLTNLTIEERLPLNVSLRMFTGSIVIQMRVEDL